MGWQPLGYATWEECCEKEFGYSRPYAYQLIGAAKVQRNLSAIADKQNIIPEGQLRPLTKIEDPDLQREVWEECCEKEFGYKRDYSYKLIAAAQVERNIACIPLYTNSAPEKHLRPLSKIKDPDLQREAWEGFKSFVYEGFEPRGDVQGGRQSCRVGSLGFIRKAMLAETLFFKSRRKLVKIRAVTNVEWPPLMAGRIEGCVPETGEGVEWSSCVRPVEAVIGTESNDLASDER
jgi:hypothetical protein